ncbi:MAG TPA: hypothetical protein PLR86_07395 [Planctomycetota bacterium]|nr:hypothetical protein [Planctomycetota bacterium]
MATWEKGTITIQNALYRRSFSDQDNYTYDDDDDGECYMATWEKGTITIQNALYRRSFSDQDNYTYDDDDDYDDDDYDDDDYDDDDYDDDDYGYKGYKHYVKEDEEYVEDFSCHDIINDGGFVILDSIFDGIL